MIAKKYRLTEREVQKVLRKAKPFFSSSLVFHRFPHRLWHARFAIVISKKSVKNAVIRNRYRRIFYTTMAAYCEYNMWDVVCVIKSKTKLTRDPACQAAFRSELLSTFTTYIWKNT